MRATSVVRFTIFGAAGFGTGAALAGALLGVVGLPLTGAVGGASLGATLGYLESRMLASERRPGAV
jgi:hypothetical protein